MRRIPRTALSARIEKYLAKKQREISDGKDPRVTWERARQTGVMKDVFQTLQRMSGPRARCMFCEDSRGSDIDHFWPLTPYKERTFVWLNMLLACTDCNRAKTNKFVLDESGRPLLINPTEENPWEYVVYVSATDMLVARFDTATNQEHPMGAHTVAEIRALNYQLVTDGRGRIRRNLHRAVTRFLGEMSRDGDECAALSELLQAIRDNDGYGLTQWYFAHEGRDEQPFAELRAKFPRVWDEIVAWVSA